MIAPFLLPYMHDRYMFAADILTVVYFITNRKNIYVPISCTLISLYTYTYYLYGAKAVSMPIVSLFFLAIIIKFTYDVFKPILTAENNVGAYGIRPKIEEEPHEKH
jgi:hypothetical protein